MFFRVVIVEQVVFLFNENYSFQLLLNGFFEGKNL